MCTNSQQNYKKCTFIIMFILDERKMKHSKIKKFVESDPVESSRMKTQSGNLTQFPALHHLALLLLHHTHWKSRH